MRRERALEHSWEEELPQPQWLEGAASCTSGVVRVGEGSRQGPLLVQAKV